MAFGLLRGFFLLLLRSLLFSVLVFIFLAAFVAHFSSFGLPTPMVHRRAYTATLA
jgi:hypothetical protein